MDERISVKEEIKKSSKNKPIKKNFSDKAEKRKVSVIVIVNQKIFLAINIFKKRNLCFS